MTVSELMAELAALEAEHGDLQVALITSYNGEWLYETPSVVKAGSLNPCKARIDPRSRPALTEGKFCVVIDSD